MSRKSDRDKPWYVVHTKTNRELLAASLLEDHLLLEVYLPEVKQSYRGRIQLRPFFPRYLFVRVDLDFIELTTINTTPGVVRVVSFGPRPLPLKDDIVEEIRQRVKKLNDDGGLPTQDFKQGDVVRVAEGPFRGVEAIFVKHLAPSDRVILLLELLGRENEIKVPLSAIERVPPRFRTTRGRGRRIRAVAAAS
ncbi:MAG: transcription/translation regulatory transformer protein RfaH [Chloroflexi bacterium]|nr:MAG: transcription/translation regulatory transformer protein RfaH [Chloroflexota bacterium]